MTWTALAVIVIALGGIYSLMRTEFAAAQDLRVASEKTVQTRDILSDLLIMHLDVETGVRGYILTGDRQFLAPYRSAIARRDSHFAELERQSDISEAALASLDSLSRQKLGDAAINLLAVESGRSGEARSRVASGTGRILMDRIRFEIATLDLRERTRLTDLTEASSKTRTRIQITLLLLLIGIAVLLALLVLSVFRSFADRREAMARTERLAERERAMYDGAVDAVLLLDSHGNIMRSNPSVSRMFGYSQAELVGKHNMFLMDENYTTQQSQVWLESVGKAGVDGAGRRQEFMGRCADGTRFETEVVISRVGSDDDKRYVASIRDISDRKRAERMKNEFVSTVSHELRTPLTSIGGSLSLLGSGKVGSIDEKAERLVNIARTNCERLVRLINDILDIEKIESGKMEFDPRRLTVAPLIERTVTANRQFAADHGVEISVNLPPWPQCVMGDPDRLEQVLTNLISNAIKHSPAGETVEVWAHQQSANLMLEVCDRGGGVPAAFREKIFSKFAMADSSDARTRGGTGLGLAIVREIIERHDGSVGFKDRDGGGSIFFVTLPMVKSIAVGTERAGDALPLVLHIDDDFDCLKVVESAFAGRADIISVGSLAEARARLRGAAFDATIIDIGMGSESGLDIVPHLRGAQPSLPIVLFTADDSAHDYLGADAVLVKSRAPLEALVETTMALVARARREVA